MNEIIYWVWLTVSLGFGSRAASRVLMKFSPEEAYKASKEEMISAGVEKKTAEKLADKDIRRAELIVEKCARGNIKIVPSVSPEYPMALHRLGDKPHVLYVRGDIKCLRGKKTAAFVGTRRASAAGLAAAERIAGELISEGYVLISGAAEGIDSVAADISLKNNVPTVAVMGVDIDRYFPAHHRALIDRIAVNGAVISEYPPDTDARFFATRNRIIVGLSDITNVIEAPLKSGALIGAKAALKLGIPTFALSLEGESFEGCRELIALGARELGGESDMRGGVVSHIADLRSSKAKKAKPKEKAEKEKTIPPGLSGTREHICRLLLDGPRSENSFVDDDHSIAQVLCALTELELDGLIVALPGGKYGLKD